MAVFGGMTITTKGIALQGKAQAGAALNYTRIAVGDGTLSGQSISALNGLISQKKNLPITRLKTQLPNKAVIGAVLSNAEITTGFYFREVGVFAQDPDVGEILYAYANSGVTADYIAPADSTDVIEKSFDCIVVVGTAANITAVIDESLVYALRSDLDAVAATKVDKLGGKQLSTEDYTTNEKAKLAGITAGAGGTGTASDTVIGNRTISDSTAPTGETGTLTTLLGWLANTIKGITGKSSWRAAPATTLEAAKVHADDATRHITAAERTTWNAKETTSGAQSKADAAKDAAINAAAQDATSKADAAESAAKNASIPTTQKGAAGGVAALDDAQFVTGKGLKLTENYKQQVFNFAFADGVTNQKVNLIFTQALGTFELTIGSTFYNLNAMGKLTKRYDGIWPVDGAVHESTMAYTEVTGFLKNVISMGDPVWDSVSKYWKIPIEAKGIAGNSFSLLVTSLSGTGATRFTLSEVYTAYPPTLPVPVQTIPDDTMTQSGYLIQKHRLTTPQGTAVNLPSEYNLNDLTINGFFDGEKFINAPNNMTNWLYIESYVHSNNQWDYRLQRATVLGGSSYQANTFERVQQDGTWGTWVEIAGDTIFKINGIVNKDYNQFTKPGTYQIYGEIPPNAPAFTAPWGILNVYVGSNNYIVQEATQTTAPFGKWHRARTETEWGPWKRELNDTDASYFAKAGNIVTFGGTNTGITTAEFITMLKSMGAHSSIGGYWVGRGDWSYGTNAYITDSGFGSIHLAGAVVEVIGYLDGDMYTIRITTPPTSGVDQKTINSEFTYVSNGPQYSPGWRRDWNGHNDDPLYKARETIPGASNLNNYLINGAYVLNVEGGAYLNGPPAGYYLLNIHAANEGFVIQEAINIFGTAKYFRGRTNAGVWSAWKKTITDADGTADSNPNTLVKRNADGNFAVGSAIYFGDNDGITYDDSSNAMYVRLDGNNYGLYHQGNDTNLMVTRTLPGTNLDLVITPGTYFLGASSTYTNGPGLDWCLMNVYRNDVGYIVQEVTGVGMVGKRYRTRAETGWWNAWMTFAVADATGGKYGGLTTTRSSVTDVQVGPGGDNTSIIAAWTPTAKANYTVKIYMKVQQGCSIIVQVVSAEGTDTVLPYQFCPADTYRFVPIFFVAAPGTTIQVVVGASASNAVYVSAVIEEA